jgi:hypothetical protein
MRRRLLRRVIQEVRWQLANPGFWSPLLAGLALSSLVVGPSLVAALGHGDVLATPFYLVLFLLAAAVFTAGAFLVLRLLLLFVALSVVGYRLWQAFRQLTAVLESDPLESEPLEREPQPAAAPAPAAPTPRQAAYATLGLADGAGLREVKQAYRHLARRLHPDVSQEPDAAARFRVVQQAYDTLSAR